MVQKPKLVSDQITPTELEVILQNLQTVIDRAVVGDVVELGCYVGTTSLFLQRSLQGTGKVLHVYDSFAGLPPKSIQDASPAGEQFVAGQLVATKAQLIKNFQQAHLPLPVIHKGWFADFASADVPSKICFAFLDGDFYSSILVSLRLVWPKLAPGAVVVMDDYHTEALPGVRRALDEWAQGHNFSVKVQASLAIVTPLV